MNIIFAKIFQARNLMSKSYKSIFQCVSLLFFLGMGIASCFGQLPENLMKSDSSLAENFNYSLDAPQPNHTKGVVVLLPGLFDSPLSIFFESNLPHLLNELNYAIVIPVLTAKGDRFDLSEKSVLQLGQLVVEYLRTSNLSEDTPIILGGFSIGGTRVLRACTITNSLMNSLNISHVFAIDPPLDLNRLLASEAKYGQRFLKDVLEKEVGTLDREKLTSLSVIDINNIEDVVPPSTRNTKIRIYTEPAIEWHITHRKRDLLDLNLLDHTVYVKLMERKHPDINIELVLSKIEGFRKQTEQRNPHSWNIVDPDEFISWIKSK